jgi:hypothetical protein
VVRVLYTYIAENECAGKSEGDRWRDETETVEWRVGRRGEKRLSEMARRTQNEDEEMWDTYVKKKK